MTKRKTVARAIGATAVAAMLTAGCGSGSDSNPTAPQPAATCCSKKLAGLVRAPKVMLQIVPSD